MSNPSECIICGRFTENGEHFVETDDGYICNDCLIDLKEIKRDHFDSFKDDFHHETDK